MIPFAKGFAKHWISFRWVSQRGPSKAHQRVSQSRSESPSYQLFQLISFRLDRSYERSFERPFRWAVERPSKEIKAFQRILQYLVQAFKRACLQAVYKDMLKACIRHLSGLSKAFSKCSLKGIVMACVCSLTGAAKIWAQSKVDSCTSLLIFRTMHSLIEFESVAACSKMCRW